MHLIILLFHKFVEPEKMYMLKSIFVKKKGRKNCLCLSSSKSSIVKIDSMLHGEKAPKNISSELEEAEFSEPH